MVKDAGGAQAYIVALIRLCLVRYTLTNAMVACFSVVAHGGSSMGRAASWICGQLAKVFALLGVSWMGLEAVSPRFSSRRQVGVESWL